MTIQEVQALCLELGIRPRGSLGQHFLVDQRVLHRILDAAQLPKGATILEIGPGPGILTTELARRAGTLYAVELDTLWAGYLQQKFASMPQVHIERRDVFRWFAENAGYFSDGEYYLVANLPYQVSSHVLRQFLSLPPKPRRMVVLLQWEVAQRVVAEAGDTSMLSIMAQSLATPRIVAKVSRRCFWPAPKVDSAIVVCDSIGWKFPELNEKAFFRVVKAGFSARRKMLINNLSSVLRIPREEVLTALQEANIDEKARAQELTLEQWRILVAAMNTRVNKGRQG